MSGFLFNRQPVKEATSVPSPTRGELDVALKAVVDAQSITAAAIFALLVSKGVVSAGEAAAYMRDIGEALRRDVQGRSGRQAGEMMSVYADALRTANI